MSNRNFFNIVIRFRFIKGENLLFGQNLGWAILDSKKTF